MKLSWERANSLKAYTERLNDCYSHDECNEVIRHVEAIGDLEPKDLQKLKRRKAARLRMLTNVKKDFDEWFSAYRHEERYGQDSFAIFVAGWEKGR